MYVPRTRLPAETLPDTFIHPHGYIRNVLLTGAVALIGTAMVQGREAFLLRADHPRSTDVLTDRPELAAATLRIDEMYPDAVPIPPLWGGYRLRPRMYEFWQGRRDRMHDRFRYLRTSDGWRIDRLAP